MSDHAIASKADFGRLLRAGALGNRLRTWDSIAEIAADRYDGPVSIRGRMPGMATARTHVPAADVPGVVRDLLMAFPQYAARDLYYNESAPDHRLILQGEFLPTAATPHGITIGPALRYNTAQVPMRAAMASGWRDAHGSAALAILRHGMSAGSWDDFEIVREQYPESIVELGIYDGFLGDTPYRNTVIWEVRNY